MPEINYIKHLRENEDLSISAIARTVGKDWKTVKKYADDGEIYLSDISYTKRSMLYNSEYGEMIDLWLEEDRKLRRKERRTNKKIWKQLYSASKITNENREGDTL